MIKIIIGVLIALAIGASCRYFEVPVPAPPKLLGAMLIVAITVGYVGMDRLMSRPIAAQAVSITDASADSAEVRDER